MHIRVPNNVIRYIKRQHSLRIMICSLINETGRIRMRKSSKKRELESVYFTHMRRRPIRADLSQIL